jgi:hypothetical protein
MAKSNIGMFEGNSYVHEIDNLLSVQECCEINRIIETKHKDEPHTLIFPSNQLQTLVFKDQLRFSFTDEKLASCIKDAINKHTMLQINKDNFSYVYDGVSNKFTYVNYAPGSKIIKHTDTYQENTTKFIILTCIIYLNDEYKEGETYYYMNGQKITIKKKIGKVQR